MKINKENNYSRETLLDVLFSYKKMIERNKEFPTALISDLETSINFVLNKNNYREGA